ncbi:MAG TPA: nucleotidyltransferase family protein [Nitrospiria bacterium]|jgi:NDP-sugar pyrophosphorylase family protein|nr:nucleotidyltransferase family protein [Nitrospiria bacterium]
MKAMILAAGLGTRLRPLTDNLPKPLLPLEDRPLIEYTLRLLRKYGLREVVINLHYQGEKIVQALGDGSRWGMKIRYSEEPQILGTGGGIKKMARFFSDEPFLVINSDILVEIRLDRLVEFHQRQNGTATLVLREDPEVDSWGAVGIDPQRRIRQFLGRPDWTGKALAKRMFAGIHVMDPRVLSYIPDQGFSTIIDAYLEMLQKGERLLGHEFGDYWMDIGTPERYRKAQEDLKGKRVRLSYMQGG